MGRFILGLIIGLCLIPAALWVYFHFGYAPVATAAGAMPFESSLAMSALHARIAKEAPKQAPIPASEENLVAGAQIYRDYCIVCHGAQTGPKTVFQQGMFPHPPLLLQGKGVTDDPPGDSYWVVENGIRTTGMPAFAHALNDTQMWQVALLVANAHNLPAAANQYISQLPPGIK